jgi:hypothetical protein
MHNVLRELVNAVERLKGISGNQAGELHAQIDQDEAESDTTRADLRQAEAALGTEVKPAPPKADVSAGA